MMMCSGASPAVCTMNSPRSVSTTSTPGRLEVLVQADLLGRHRLALHDHAAVAQHDLGHVAGGVGARRRAVDDGPGRLELRLERVEQRWEVVDGPRAGGLAGGAKGFEVDALEPADAIVGRALREPRHVRALARIGQRGGGARLEAAHRASARTVARCTTRTPAPDAGGPALDLHHAPRVGARDGGRRDRGGRRQLVVGHRRRDIRVADRERAAEPAAAVGPRQLVQLGDGRRAVCAAGRAGEARAACGRSRDR